MDRVEGIDGVRADVRRVVIEVGIVTNRPMQVLCGTSGERSIAVRQWWLPWRRVRRWWCSCCGAVLPNDNHLVHEEGPGARGKPDCRGQPAGRSESAGRSSHRRGAWRQGRSDLVWPQAASVDPPPRDLHAQSLVARSPPSTASRIAEVRSPGSADRRANAGVAAARPFRTGDNRRRCQRRRLISLERRSPAGLAPRRSGPPCLDYGVEGFHAQVRDPDARRPSVPSSQATARPLTAPDKQSSGCEWPSVVRGGCWTRRSDGASAEPQWLNSTGHETQRSATQESRLLDLFGTKFRYKERPSRSVESF